VFFFFFTLLAFTKTDIVVKLFQFLNSPRIQILSCMIQFYRITIVVQERTI